MAEKRKAHHVILLRKPGKKCNKIELFRSFEWSKTSSATKNHGGFGYRKYRIRVNGKWFNEDGYRYSFYNRFEVRDLIWRSSKKMF